MVLFCKIYSPQSVFVDGILFSHCLSVGIDVHPCVREVPIFVTYYSVKDELLSDLANVCKYLKHKRSA